MEVVVISFRAFDKPQVESFVNKSFEQIHIELNKRCNTYVLTSIFKMEPKGDYLALDNITKHQIA